MMQSRFSCCSARALGFIGVLMAVGCFYPPPDTMTTVSAPPPEPVVQPAPAPEPVPVANPAPFGQATGTISYPGETVQYPLAIDYTRTVSIYVQGYGLDPTLRVFDAYGNQVGYNDDGGTGLDSQLALTLIPGTYTLEVAGYGGSTGGFSITAQ